MDYQAMYQQKLTTAEEAVKVVRSGDWVDYTWCTNHPIALDKALAARKDELTDVKVRGGVTMWMPEIAKAEDAGDHFTWHSWHCSARSSPRAWATSVPCATPSCPASTGRIWPLWTW